MTTEHFYPESLDDEYLDIMRLMDDLSTVKIDIKVRKASIYKYRQSEHQSKEREDYFSSSEKEVIYLEELKKRLEAKIDSFPPLPLLPPPEPLIKISGTIDEITYTKALACFDVGAPVRVRNLCPPSMPCYPPNENRFHWKLLSQLGSSFLWMMNDAEVLRNTLALYDWTDSETHRRRLNGILNVEHHRLEYWKRGLIRGVDIEVTLDTTMFAGMGDVWLFGSLLNRFFAQYADMHLFNRLTLILQPTGLCLRWKENHQSASRG